MNEPVYRCGVEVTLSVIGGKWKGLILWHLRLKTLRFSQLQRRLQSVTQKMLTQQLRELEAEGLIHRQVFAEVPPKVEYSLTERGLSVVPMLELMCDWGQDYLRETKGIELDCADIKAPASA
ncbi:winged helix-turn-helix transcriptional regulator [Geopsychrobacter electrodiphilus]|uniref:winged helix-turn-helix transcriptional regulator n=1 Tax=Geopsychrobacter electrodiphilus TaxID=225196 RepID=UPI00037D8C16|nr:helix-turn-helix domain-containing protein [Geopsychrobacter electrodiphilus]